MKAKVSQSIIHHHNPSVKRRSSPRTKKTDNNKFESVQLIDTKLLQNTIGYKGAESSIVQDDLGRIINGKQTHDRLNYHSTEVSLQSPSDYNKQNQSKDRIKRYSNLSALKNGHYVQDSQALEQLTQKQAILNQKLFLKSEAQKSQQGQNHFDNSMSASANPHQKTVKNTRHENHHNHISNKSQPRLQLKLNDNFQFGEQNHHMMHDYTDSNPQSIREAQIQNQNQLMQNMIIDRTQNLNAMSSSPSNLFNRKQSNDLNNHRKVTLKKTVSQSPAPVEGFQNSQSPFGISKKNEMRSLINNQQKNQFILPSKALRSETSVKMLPAISRSRLSNTQNSPGQIFEGLQTGHRNLSSYNPMNTTSHNNNSTLENFLQQNKSQISPNMKIQLQQHQSHQINLQISRTHQSRIKAAIQKQIVEFAHRQGGLQLQDVYHKRQLAGVQKETKTDHHQIKKQAEEVIQEALSKKQQKTSTQGQQSLQTFEKSDSFNGEKNKRIDFIQKLIDQSNQKQINMIKFHNEMDDQSPKAAHYNTIGSLPTDVQTYLPQNYDELKKMTHNYAESRKIKLSDQEVSNYAKGFYQRQKRNSTQLDNLGYHADQVLELGLTPEQQNRLRNQINVVGGSAQGLVTNINSSHLSPQPAREKLMSLFTEIDYNCKLLNEGRSPRNNGARQSKEGTASGQPPSSSALSFTKNTNGMMSTSKKKGKIQQQDAYFAQQRAPMKPDHDGIRDSQEDPRVANDLMDGQQQVEGPDNFDDQSNQNAEQRMSSKLSKTQTQRQKIKEKERYLRNNDIKFLTNMAKYNSDNEAHNQGLAVMMQRRNIQFQAAHEVLIQTNNGQLSAQVTGQKLKLPNQMFEQDFIKMRELRLAQSTLSPQITKLRQEPIAMKNNIFQPTDFEKSLINASQISAYEMGDGLRGGLRQSKDEIEQDNELRILFGKLGLNYDVDVPPRIKTQLKMDVNAKKVLEDLSKELEENGSIKDLHQYLNQSSQQGLESAEKEKAMRPQTLIKIKNEKKRAKNQSPLKAGETGPANPQSFNPSNCQSVRPHEGTLIEIINPPFKKHHNHPINKFLRLSNDFCLLTLVKASNFRGSSQKVQHFDMQQIGPLARQLKIEIPKNYMGNDLQQLFKSKQFIVQVKAQVLQKLFSIINKENEIQLNFERQSFQFYKGYIGKGNNAALIVSLFKQHRWWWSVYQSLLYDEDGNPVLPYSAQQALNNQQLNLQLYKESFAEHNFLWTQWKKLKHYPWLKTPAQAKQTVKNSESEDQESQIQSVEPPTSATTTFEKDDKPQNTQIIKQPSKPDESTNNHNIGSGNPSNKFRVYSKLENNYHLSNKYALFHNMRKYYKVMNRDPFEVLPLTFHIKTGANDPSYTQFLNKHKEIENMIKQATKDEKDLLKKQKALNNEVKETASRIESLKDDVKNWVESVKDEDCKQNDPSGEMNAVNESEPASAENTIREHYSRKDTLDENNLILPVVTESSSKPTVDAIIDEQAIRKMNQKRNQIEVDLEREQRNKLRVQTLLTEIKHKLDKTQKIKQLKNIWIVKPGENTNRGVGISVQTKSSDIRQIISQADGSQRTFILQRYIETPALYKNRKFDIRCFAVVSSTNGHLKAYNYDEGYLRTSGREYNTKTFNKFIHLTNDAVQKRSEDYGRFEFGNKVSFVEYQQYLNQTVPHLNIDFRQHIFSQIKTIMTDTIRACYKVLDPYKRSHSFEILGYDFMLDDNFKVYLIESNTNPCLETTCPILHKVITDLVDSGLRLALDPLFPPPNYTKRMSQQIPLTLWELCYDSRLDEKEVSEIFEEYNKKQEKEEQGPLAAEQTKDKEEYFDESLLKEEELDEVYD